MAWAAIARAIVETHLVHPVALFVVWLVGFVWMTGYIITDSRGADLLTKRWAQMLLGIFAIAAIIVLLVERL